MLSLDALYARRAMHDPLEKHVGVGMSSSFGATPREAILLGNRHTPQEFLNYSKAPRNSFLPQITHHRK